MPIHDWTRLPPEIFHHFHQDWSIEIARYLNRGVLPKGLSALVEQRYGVRETDILTVETKSKRHRSVTDNGGAVLMMEPPATQIMRRSNKEIYAGRANRIVIKHHLDRIIAVIEIMSPGNKDSRAALQDFVDKAVQFLREGIHLLVVDLFPPSPRDPFGMHKVIWDYIVDEPFAFPEGKDRILASYESGGERAAYVEPVGLGDVLPEMPLFLVEGGHVKVPLESTYRATWEASPEELRIAVETGVPPGADDE